ncbi:MAG: phage protease [Alphaproteobacteria bacterium]
MERAEFLSVTLTTEPPHEFVIFSAGDVTTSKGDFVFDDKAAALVLAAFSEHGQDKLPIDFDHLMVAESKSIEGASAAGWFVPEVRNGALMATSVQWTPRAERMIRDREFRFLSPAFYYDDKSGRINELINVALTNLPATKNAVPLVANAVPQHSPKPVEEATWDAEAAEARIRIWATKDGELDPKRYREGFAWYDGDKELALSSYKLPHHDIIADQLVTVRGGVIAAGSALMGSRGGVEIPEDQLPAVRAHLARHYAQFDMTPPWQRREDNKQAHSGRKRQKTMSEKLYKLLGADDEADSFVIAAEWNKTGAELLSVTGTKSLSAAMAAVSANAKLPAEMAKLSAEVAALNTDKAARERDALIATLSEAGKLPPAMHEWARSLPTEALSAFADVAPAHPGATEAAAPGDNHIRLTAEDEKVIASGIVGREQFIETKRAIEAGKKGG